MPLPVLPFVAVGVIVASVISLTRGDDDETNPDVKKESENEIREKQSASNLDRGGPSGGEQQQPTGTRRADVLDDKTVEPPATPETPETPETEIPENDETTSPPNAD